ncbi:MAG: HAD hydrolase-like protein [Bacillota bacterium]|nr:HAD hydrolase-like protein [Bacillota bacterium]
MAEKLIIFDMDNTLLRSKIDFALMKSEVLRLLAERGLIGEPSWPSAKIINYFRERDLLPASLEQEIWRRITEIEYQGLASAEAEPGVHQALKQLAAHAHLAVVSNNIDAAVRDNLDRLGISEHLQLMMGRGAVPQLKPSPLGILAAAAHFPQLTPADCVTIGDALNDNEAAAAAGMDFIAYNGSRSEDWRRCWITPRAYLHSWDEQAVQTVLDILEA